MGLGGTGKSFTLAELVRRYPKLHLTAYTGKAASVLRQRVQVPVMTLHSAIYNFNGLVEDDIDADRMNPIFSAKDISYHGQTILIDECSMVSETEAADLLATGARVIASGDPGQLQPVRSTPFFTTPDFTLTEIHRQAWDSPIIRQAHGVRSNGRYVPDGPNFQVLELADLRDRPETILDYEILLCWRNRTRRQLNKRKRELLGLPSGEIVTGEPMMCLKNSHPLGIWNGAIYEYLAREGGDILLRDGEREVRVYSPTVEGFDPLFRDKQRTGFEDDVPFAMAYATTVHKAQGSEFPSVLIFDEAEREWRNWMYTAITRAVERCTVVRFR